jgi:hypothetical protein
MNDDLPEIFRTLTARPAPAELRAKVLAAAACELASSPRRSRPRWERICELSVAAALLAGVGLHVARWRADRDLEARVYGPRPVPSAVARIAADVESVTDASTGRWLRARLSAARPRTTGGATSTSDEYRRLIDDFAKRQTGGKL